MWIEVVLCLHKVWLPDWKKDYKIESELISIENHFCYCCSCWIRFFAYIALLIHLFLSTAVYLLFKTYICIFIWKTKPISNENELNTYNKGKKIDKVQKQTLYIFLCYIVKIKRRKNKHTTNNTHTHRPVNIMHANAFLLTQSSN